MTFTREQIEELLEIAQGNCFQPTDTGDMITDHMNGAFNNGVRLMMKEVIYQLLMKETGKKVSA